MTNLTTVEIPTFIRKKHELAKLFKELNSAADEAVQSLLNTMRNTDSEKIRLECAKLIIESTKDIGTQINADEMARLVAEAKFGTGAVKTLKLKNGEDEKAYPALDFDTIREV